MKKEIKDYYESKKNESIKLKDISSSDIQDNIDTLEDSIATPEKSIRYSDKSIENRDVNQQITGLNLMATLQLIEDGKNPIPPLATMISIGRRRR